MLSKACIVGTYQRKLEEMALATPDMELTVAVPDSWRDERGTTRLERVHTHGYRLEVLPLAFNGQFHLHFYPTLGRLLHSVKPDIVHIDEEPYNLATYHAQRSAQRADAKTLWFSWQNLQRRYPPPFSWMERYNLHHAAYALTGSQTAAQVWRDKGYTGPLAVIPQFGVDPELFTPPETPRLMQPVHIGYAGRLVPEKGVDVLLAALAGLDGEWRATLVGSGPEEDALRALAESHHLTDRIAFRPWLPSTEMPAFYQQSDIVVLPSRTRPNWTEQFGRTLVEAMACGAVVVGARSGEIPHVIGDGGLTFPEGDADALRDILCTLIHDAVLRAEWGARGRERVLAHFTQRQIALETVQVYRNMLQ